jgi:hypothetical protein
VSDGISVSASTEDIIARIRTRQARLGPKDPKLRAAMYRIGAVLEAKAKITARRKGIIDTGNLINHIAFQFSGRSQLELEFGVFGVPYAKVHEFGFHGTVQVRALHRQVSKVFGRNVTPFMQEVRAHARRMNVRARPFIRPTVFESRQFIVDTLREAMTG